MSLWERRAVGEDSDPGSPGDYSERNRFSFGLGRISKARSPNRV